MKVQRRGPATLAQVVLSIEAMEKLYSISTKEFQTDPDPTRRVPEDDATQWVFLIAQRDALQTIKRPSDQEWTPNYQKSQGDSTRLPAVDRELVECGVAA